MTRPEPGDGRSWMFADQGGGLAAGGQEGRERAGRVRVLFGRLWGIGGWEKL